MQPTASFITSIGTAVPDHQIPQPQIARFMAEALSMDERDQRRLSALYRQTRIDQRHSVLPDYARARGEYTFYPNTEGLEPFPTVGQRMKIYREEAVPLALKAIDDCLAAYPGFDKQRITHVVTVSCTAWHVTDFGFEMTLTSEVPSVIQRGIGQMLSRLLETSGLSIGDIGTYAMHPGGRRILEVIEGQLGLDNSDNRYAYDVLRQYGNMSSATVLFVLKAIWHDMQNAAPANADEATFNILSCAFGPGLTLESMILEANYCPVGEQELVTERYVSWRAIKSCLARFVGDRRAFL